MPILNERRMAMVPLCKEGKEHDWYFNGKEGTHCMRCWHQMPSGWVPPEWEVFTVVTIPKMERPTEPYDPQRVKRKRASKGASMRQKLSTLVLRDGAYCHYCRIPFDLLDDEINPPSVDHVIPRVKFGTNDLSNLVPACKRCNNLKSDTDYDVFIATVKVWKNPTEWGVAPRKPPPTCKKKETVDRLPPWVIPVMRDDKRW